VNAPRTITVFTHSNPRETGAAVRRLAELAAERGIEVRLPPAEARKHHIGRLPGVVQGGGLNGSTDLAVVFGGDGTILEALRAFAGRQVPVFALNYGAIGFLSTVDQDRLEEGLQLAVRGEFDIVRMPALAVETGHGRRLGVNDISFHRRPNSRVAELAYAVEGEPLGRVRCDGLVVSTPVGSTGYNLANGGPVLAWGVDGYVVSFIAPHTLTARALVVAPHSVLRVANVSDRDGVDVTTDGRSVTSLPARRALEIRFLHEGAQIAQLPGSTFYRRFREKFGRLG
jgi:NAD+ kinase